MEKAEALLVATSKVIEMTDADSPVAWEYLGLLLIDVLQTLIVPLPLMHCSLWDLRSGAENFLPHYIFILTLVTKKTAAVCRSHWNLT